LSALFADDHKAHRDSLVYDLMEVSRAKVDDAMLRLLATTTFKRGDIIKVEDGSCRLSPQLARFIVASCTLPQADIDKSALWFKALLLHSRE
jgi:CRISPR associated protein Cas1